MFNAPQLGGGAIDAHELAMQRLHTLRSSIAGLLGNPQLQSKDVLMMAGSLVGQGLATPQHIADIVGGMPRDPDKLRSWLASHLVHVMNAQKQFEAQPPQQQQYMPQNRLMSFGGMQRG